MIYKSINIGSRNVNLSAFALGTHIFGMDRISKSLNEKDSAKILYQYVEGGGNVIDTARSYQNSENYIGRCIAADSQLRNRLFIMTKGGNGEYQKDG